MGTRADFYTTDGRCLEWRGSIAWSGYPSGIAKHGEGILTAKSEGAFLLALAKFLEKTDHARKPDDGWPWPWDDSRTSDYAYVFNGDHVDAYRFGYGPFDPNTVEPDRDENKGKTTIFPNMKDRANVTDGGFIMLSVPK